MPLSTTTVSDDGFASTSTVREFEFDVDPAGEAAPDTREMLMATYAACYVPALRVAAEQRGHGELGRVEIDVTGHVNDADKLDAIEFSISTDADLDDDAVATIVERANELCKVHDAVKDGLKAAITVDGIAAA